MCGICGKLNFNSQPVELKLIESMNSCLQHRGPDEEGYYLSPDYRFGMAMRRLRVIDLSSGSQPIFNEDRTIGVVFNGEIYNYIELREELRRAGHTFLTQSDTEVLVHAYESYGADFLTRLNGMFAIAIWDEKKMQLLLARDRIGVKPLYLRADAKTIAFASELKALLADPDCRKEIDPSALDDYFSLLYVPGPRSIFKTIKKCPPGHYLICDAKNGTVVQRPYWERKVNINPPDMGWDYYREKLDELFLDALKLELRSDVPNGLYLSSGLDSATIAYYASKATSRPLQSFTVHFKEASYSEQAGAKKIAERCGCQHHEIVLEPNAQDLVLRTSEYLDEPFADSSALPTFLLAEFARKKITVALSGEGGDELFAGYPTYIATRWAQWYRKLPRAVRAGLKKAIHQLPVSWDRISWDYKLKQFTSGAEESPERSHFAWKEIFTNIDKKLLYSSEFLALTQSRSGFESFATQFNRLGSGVDLEKLLYVDQNTYLVDQFLVKSDRMSMAHSLEVRVPLLDHRIVEFAGEIPAKYKLRGLTTKWTLRKLMAGRLPPEILNGPKKGFSPPLPYWISGPLKPFIKERLSPDQINKTGLFQAQSVQNLLAEHFAKKRDNHRRIWALLNFMLWYDRWMPNQGGKGR